MLIHSMLSSIQNDEIPHPHSWKNTLGNNYLLIVEIWVVDRSIPYIVLSLPTKEVVHVHIVPFVNMGSKLIYHHTTQGILIASYACQILSSHKTIMQAPATIVTKSYLILEEIEYRIFYHSLMTIAFFCCFKNKSIQVCFSTGFLIKDSTKIFSCYFLLIFFTKSVT